MRAGAAVDGRGAWPLAWSLLGLVLLGIVLFGSVQAELAHLLAGLLMAGSAVLLFGQPPERRPSKTFALLALALPAWIALQMIPLPRALAGLLSPNAARWAETNWPGPLHGCTGAVLLGERGAFLALSVDPSVSRGFLFQAAAALLVFLAARALFRDDDRHGSGARRRVTLLAVIVVFTALEAAYGIVQTLSQSPHVLWVEKLTYLDSASGTLMNRNHFALVLYLGLGCTLSLLARRIERTVRRADQGREMAIRTTLAVAGALQFAGILASKSRAGLAGGLIVAAAGAPPLFARGGRISRWFGVAVAALVTLPVLLFFGPAIVERLAAVPVEWTSPGGRGEVLRLSGAMIRDFPLFGTGAGTFETAFPPYRSAGIKGLYNYAHNDHLQLLIETGVLGLALALAPVAAFAVDAVRRRRREKRGDDLPFTPWAVYVALGAVALHELVEFALQMPALAFLVAFLAGGFYPWNRGEAPAGRRLSFAPAAAGAVLCLPAAAASIALWPGIGGLLPLPRLAERHVARAEERAARFKAHPADPAPLCAALGETARAQALRPLVGTYALRHAQYIVQALETPGVPETQRDLLRDEASRLADKARRFDPNNTWGRQRAMSIALAVGDLDRAVEDASVIVSGNPALTATTVRTLIDVGLPPSLVSRVVPREPVALRTVLQELVTQNDFATAGQLVPADVVADRALCSNASLVRRILEKAHQRPARGFLEACLAQPAWLEPAWVQRAVALTLAEEHLGRNEFDEARAVLARIEPGADRLRGEMLLAEALRDWPAVIANAVRLLDSLATTQDARGRASLRFRLGRAYAMSGRLDDALRELERAKRLDPMLQVDAQMRELRRGGNPF